MRESIPLLILASVVLAMSGCSEADSEPPWIELGAGLDSFRSLSEGDPLSLVHGSQGGGWHIDLALRFGGYGPDGVHLSYSASDPESGDKLTFVTEALLQERLVHPFDQGWERFGDRVVFDVDDADEVIDEEILIEVVLSYEDEQRSDSQRVVVVDP